MRAKKVGPIDHRALLAKYIHAVQSLDEDLSVGWIVYRFGGPFSDAEIAELKVLASDPCHTKNQQTSV